MSRRSIEAVRVLEVAARAFVHERTAAVLLERGMNWGNLAELEVEEVVT